MSENSPVQPEERELSRLAAGSVPSSFRWEPILIGRRGEFFMIPLISADASLPVGDL